MNASTNKLKLFLENFIIFGFGGAISHVVPYLLLPIITRMMPNTEYYGISDLSTTAISLGTMLAVMGMYDAMYRMFFEKDEIDFKKQICSTTFAFVLCTSAVVAFMVFFLRDVLAVYVYGTKQYTYLFNIVAAAIFVGGTNSILAAPTRMQNKRKTYIIMNVLSSTFSYSIAILLLWKGYYTIALPFAALLSAIICGVVFFVLNRQWFGLKKIRIAYLKSLLIIGIPLLPCSLTYWIFNSSDRVMITNILGADSAGIYAVGAKAGHISQLIYTAFAGGWQYFAFSIMKEGKQVETNSKIFEYLGIISYACSLFVFSAGKYVFQFFITGDYSEGYIVVPYLFLAPLLQMLFQVISNQFLVVKKTWHVTVILLIGACINITLNVFLIPCMGIEGAAIATLIGYALANVICVLTLLKMKLIVVRKRFVYGTVLLIAFVIGWRTFLQGNLLLSIFASLVLVGEYIRLYKNDLKQMVNRLGADKREKKRKNSVLE